MTYHISKTLDCGFDEAIEKATAALKDKGFGVLTTIDVQATMKKKIDKDMPAYTILGSCNPTFAWEAIGAEPHIGTMLPCNVIVREVEGGVEVSAVDPMASMQSVENPKLGEVATTVTGLLKDVIASL